MEEVLKNTEQTLNNLTTDFKILVCTFNILHEWITKQFGVELINKESSFYKRLNPKEYTNNNNKELDEILQDLTYKPNHVNTNNFDDIEIEIVGESRPFAILERIDEILQGQKDSIVNDSAGGTEFLADKSNQKEEVQASTSSSRSTTNSNPNIKTTTTTKSCPYCGKSFPIKPNCKIYDNHLKKHFRGEQFRCSTCHKSYYNKGSLVRHVARVHAPQTSTKFPCTYCDKIWCSTWELNKHMIAVHQINANIVQQQQQHNEQSPGTSVNSNKQVVTINLDVEEEGEEEISVVFDNSRL